MGDHKMGFHNEHDNSIRRYLLGDLSEQEVAHVEQLLMSDDDVYQELLFTEDDLIDDYVSNALSNEERTKFKLRFMAVPELRQSVGFTSALKKHALATLPQNIADQLVTRKPALLDWLGTFFRQPVFATSFAAVLVAAIALQAWLIRQNIQLRGRVARLEEQTNPATGDLQEQLTAARQRNEQLSAELVRQQQLLAEESRKVQLVQQQTRPTPGTNRSSFLALTLTSGFIRETGKWTTLSLQPANREVSFTLDVAGGDYRRYEGVLQTIEGQPKWSKKDLRFRAGVTFNVPARILAPGDYRIVLSGVNSSGTLTEVGNYYFRVLK